MLYSLYELGHLSVAPLRIAALMRTHMLRSPLNPAADTEIARTAAAASQLFESMTRRYRKPDWNLPTTMVNGAEVAVAARSVWSSPWCRLLHFARDVGDRVVFMDEGRIVEEGAPADVLDRPRKERTQRFLRRSLQLAHSLDELTIDEGGTE